MQSNIMLDIPAGSPPQAASKSKALPHHLDIIQLLENQVQFFTVRELRDRVGSCFIDSAWNKQLKIGKTIAAGPIWLSESGMPPEVTSVAAMASRKANSNMRVAQKYQSPKMHGHMHTLPNLGRLVPPFLSQSPIACTNANSFNFFGLWMGDQLLEARFFQQWLSSWIPSHPEDVWLFWGCLTWMGDEYDASHSFII